METPTYILFVLGWLGATDIALFHSVAHGIRSHPDSAKELVTHSLRGPTYAALFMLVPNFHLRGLFAWGLVGLLVFDVGISIWDFSLEQGSRRFLGGLPSGEYVLHMLMAMVFGALVASFLYSAGEALHAPTSLAYGPAKVPPIVRLILAVMAILVLASGVQDAAAALRLRMLPHRTEGFPAREGDSTVRDPTALARNGRLVAETVDADARSKEDPGWMRVVLVAAGVYNLLWGAWVVLFPAAIFRWAGMTPTNYPQIWQCVGMIVGVYGIGYLLASQAPVRHWPIVLVGLLGKVLGPAGMWWSVAKGGLPAGFAWTCLTNDLIWWLPFALILSHAFKVHRDPRFNLNLS